MTSQIQYAAKLDHVREVSLLATADLDYWRQRLEPEELRPAELEGHAQILVMAADGRFLGWRFQELSISVLIEPPVAAPQQAGAYLVQAFNSRWLFAGAERWLFGTPYEFGVVRVAVEASPAMELLVRSESLFRAACAEDGPLRREPESPGPGGWSGPVFLPRRSHSIRQPGNYFIAEISGQTHSCAWSPTTDSLAIRPEPAFPVFQALLDSHFTPREWAVRPDAHHAKSKTYSRATAKAAH